MASPSEAAQAARPAAQEQTAVLSLVNALQNLVESQKNSSFTKHLKPPELFKPETRQAEIGQWSDWRFTFENFVGAIDSELLSLMKNAEKEDGVVNDHSTLRFVPSQRNSMLC